MIKKAEILDYVDALYNSVATSDLRSAKIYANSIILMINTVEKELVHEHLKTQTSKKQLEI